MSLPTHIPVLAREAIEGLQAQPGGYVIDCTVGLGGHAAAILKRISPQGRLLGIDADPEAIRVARAKLGTIAKQLYWLMTILPTSMLSAKNITSIQSMAFFLTSVSPPCNWIQPSVALAFSARLL
jgi:16S rRNA (cytosine1402-N4)-methyltransferase